jgi:hypothetical protein
MAEEIGHSHLGASKAERWLNCPGSVRLCAGVEKRDSIHAREGKAAHKLAEICLTSGQDPADYVSRFVDGFEVTPEMAEAVAVYVDYCRGTEMPGDIVRVEHKFILADFDAELWGTCDRFLYRPSTGLLKVDDYKHGAGVFVDERDNPQTMFYAIGALMAAPGPVETVEITIVQPRYRDGGDGKRTWQTTPAALLAFGERLADGAARTRRPDAPLEPGKWCRFCDARAVCPALEAAAFAAAQDEFEPIGDEVPPATVNPADLSPEELGRRLAQVPFLEEWIKAIREHAFKEAVHGRVPAGFKLVAKFPRNREWKDADVAMMQAAVRFQDIDREDFYKREPLSPAQFEKLVGRTRSSEFLKAFLADRKPNGYSLVPETDKREAVEPDFEAIGNTDDDAP